MAARDSEACMQKLKLRQTMSCLLKFIFLLGGYKMAFLDQFSLSTDEPKRFN